MPRRENLSEDQILKRLLELDEEWEDNSSDSFYCSEDDGESDCVLDSLGSMSSDDEDTQRQLSASHPIMSEQYGSRDRHEVWHSNCLTQATVRTSSCNIVCQECGPSHFAKRSCDSIDKCFTIFMHQNLLEVIRKWTNVEARHKHNSAKDCYNNCESPELNAFYRIDSGKKSKKKSMLNLR
ncbi:Hypothetical predicted protein [Octopus vulgaris]|uniref:Uncharacterized protein n=1 Tax=Octopus vulgaris TaxID=6645 RepID=A0AA36AXA8_OCTVU|nr:Hypothetical predicted protein [Octopus vulgaris]